MLQTFTRNDLSRVFKGSAARDIIDIIDLVDGPGQRYYVDSNAGSDTNTGRSWVDALATLDAAVGHCTASRGDVIYIKPGHAETLSADSAVDIDVAGVTVIGLGKGSARPTFTFDTAATADFKLAAAGVVVYNLLFVAGIDALTGPIEISAADCQLIDCEYRDNATSNFETTDVVTLLTAAHRCLIDGFKFVSDGGAGGTQIQSVINLVSADECEIRNCWIVCDGALGCIEDGTASAQVHIHDNYLECSHANSVAITLQATTTGLVADNRIKVAGTLANAITAGSDVGLFENYVVDTDAQTGGLIGTPSA